MNHFTILSIKPSFTLDLTTLEAAYFAAQRQYHPDRFVNKSAEEKLAAAQKSADINEAYNTLKHPLTRAQHLLKLHGVEIAEIKPSQELLMEVMELRENGENVNGLISDCISALAKAFEKSDVPAATELTSRLAYLYRANI